jgi:hypothetical protein
MNARIVLIAMVLLAWVTCAQAAVVYNAANDFSITANQNGVWSYGQVTVGTNIEVTSFTPLTVAASGAGESAWADGSAPRGTGLEAWVSSLAAPDPAVSFNSSASPVTYSIWTWPAHTLVLDGYPGNQTSYVDVRWTAPADGVIDIVVDYTAITTAGTAYGSNEYVSLNGAMINYRNITPTVTNTGNFTQSGISVTAGETVDFWQYGCITAVAPQVTFTPVPEPSTLVLLATGLISLVCYAWRKRK